MSFVLLNSGIEWLVFVLFCSVGAATPTGLFLYAYVIFRPSLLFIKSVVSLCTSVECPALPPTIEFDDILIGAAGAFFIID